MGQVVPTFLMVSTDETDEYPAVTKFNEWLRGSGQRPMVRMDTNRESYGGSKTMVDQTYVGVLTGHSAEGIVEVLRELDWKSKEDPYVTVEVLIKGDDDLHYSLHRVFG